MGYINKSVKEMESMGADVFKLTLARLKDIYHFATDKETRGKFWQIKFLLPTFLAPFIIYYTVQILDKYVYSVIFSYGLKATVPFGVFLLYLFYRIDKKQKEMLNKK